MRINGPVIAASAVSAFITSLFGFWGMKQAKEQGFNHGIAYMACAYEKPNQPCEYTYRGRKYTVITKVDK